MKVTWHATCSQSRSKIHIQTKASLHREPTPKVFLPYYHYNAQTAKHQKTFAICNFIFKKRTNLKIVQVKTTESLKLKNHIFPGWFYTTWVIIVNKNINDYELLLFISSFLRYLMRRNRRDRISKRTGLLLGCFYPAATNTKLLQNLSWASISNHWAL